MRWSSAFYVFHMKQLSGPKGKQHDPPREDERHSMNTTGILFDNANSKTYQAAPDFSGKFVLTEPFLKACVEAWRAGRAAGPVEAKIEGRWKKGGKVEWINLSLIPPK